MSKQELKQALIDTGDFDNLDLLVENINSSDQADWVASLLVAGLPPVYAAAPQLLKALEKCEHLLVTIANKLGGHTHGTDMDTLSARTTARKAISIAKGKP